MNKAFLIITAAAVALAPGGASAKKEPINTLALQQMQSREFEVTKDEAFAAVMTVLQDSGYRIQAADRDTGLITGMASTKTGTTWMPFVGFGKKKLTPVVSAYVEQRGASVSRVRLNFVMSKMKANQYGGQTDEKPIMEPAVYTDAFERINKEVFVRVAMRTVPAPAVAATSPAGTATATTVATSPKP